MPTRPGKMRSQVRRKNKLGQAFFGSSAKLRKQRDAYEKQVADFDGQFAVTWWSCCRQYTPLVNQVSTDEEEEDDDDVGATRYDTVAKRREAKAATLSRETRCP